MNTEQQIADQQQIYSSDNLNWSFIPDKNYENMSYFMNEQAMFPIQQDPQIQVDTNNNNDSNNVMGSLESSFDMMYSWNTNVQVPPMIKEDYTINNSTSIPHHQQTPQLFSYSQPLTQQQAFILPPTSSNISPSNYNTIDAVINGTMDINMTRSMSYTSFYQTNTMQQQSHSRETTPPSSSSTSDSNSPNSLSSTPPSLSYFLPPPPPQQQQQQQYMIAPQLPLLTVPKNRNNRRKSTGTNGPTRTYCRRASSHPSVASVVSLSAHEPVAHVINGIEHITFLYSHDRLVKEYTVRTDVSSVNLQEISLDFRAQNAIYPRANVSREEYDGNRWDYETSCNRLGWELCWLNRDELCGQRGLIQRAVDSYRNRHADMRSRRVTRQEKVANGTLRKRRAKKAVSAIL